MATMLSLVLTSMLLAGAAAALGRNSGTGWISGDPNLNICADKGSTNPETTSGVGEPYCSNQRNCDVQSGEVPPAPAGYSLLCTTYNVDGTNICAADDDINYDWVPTAPGGDVDPTLGGSPVRTGAGEFGTAADHALWSEVDLGQLLPMSQSGPLKGTYCENTVAACSAACDVLAGCCGFSFRHHVRPPHL